MQHQSSVRHGVALPRGHCARPIGQRCRFQRPACRNVVRVLRQGPAIAVGRLGQGSGLDQGLPEIVPCLGQFGRQRRRPSVTGQGGGQTAAFLLRAAEIEIGQGVARMRLDNIFEQCRGFFEAAVREKTDGLIHQAPFFSGFVRHIGLRDPNLKWLDAARALTVFDLGAASRTNGFVIIPTEISRYRDANSDDPSCYCC